MTLLLSLLLAFASSHLQLRVLHQIIPSDAIGRAQEPAVIFVKPQGCRQIDVVVDGPVYNHSAEPAMEGKTHRFEYRELTTGEYLVTAACVGSEDDPERVLQTVSTGLQVS